MTFTASENWVQCLSLDYGKITHADCPSYMAANYRRPCLYCRHCSPLEQSVAACHVRNITVCRPQQPEDTPL